MLAIVHIDPANGVPLAWLIATDTDDARRRAEMAGNRALAKVLYRIPHCFRPERGKVEIMPNHWILAQ
jgi:hypothetical protein